MEEKKEYKTAETITIADAVAKLTAAFEKANSVNAVPSRDEEHFLFHIGFSYPVGEIPSHVLALYNCKPGKRELAARTCYEDMFIEILTGGEDDSAE